MTTTQLNQYSNSDEEVKPSQNGAGPGHTDRVLDPEERQYLDARAVPAALRDDLDHYYTAKNPVELQKLGFSKYISRRAVPALVMVGHCLNGDTFVQIKPRKPIEIEDFKTLKIKRTKALFPKGGGGRMHVAKGTEKHAGDPRRPLLLGESIVKTDAAAFWPDEEVLSGGFGGSSGFKAPNWKGGRTILEDLRSLEIAYTGRDKETGEDITRDIWCLFDGNVQTNDGVAKAALSLGGFFQNHKRANYHIIGLPDGLGLDDWRAKNPNATFADLRKLEITETLDLGAINYQKCKAQIDERYAVDTVSDEIINLSTGAIVSPYKFDKVGASIYEYDGADGKRRPAAERWRKDPHRNSRNGRIWLPGAPNPTTNNEYNEFSPLPAPTVDIPMDLVMANLNSWFFPLLRHNYREEREAAYLLYLVMLKRRNPAFKIPIGIILWGLSGSGKSLLFQAIGRMLFDTYFSCPSKTQLKSNFNASYTHKKLIILCEEIESPDNQGAKSDWKNRISEAALSINAKFQQERAVVDYLFYLFTSNHARSFPIDPAAGGDRRFFVTEVLESFGKLNDVHPGLGARVYGMLLPETSLDPEKARRDMQVSTDCLRTYFDKAEFEAFDLTGDAMMTAAKRRMYRLQRTATSRQAHELAADVRMNQEEHDALAVKRGEKPKPHHSNLLLIKKSLALIDPHDRKYTQWCSALEMAGAKQLQDPVKPEQERVVRIGSNSHRPYALLNFDYWNNLGDDALRDAVEKLVGDYHTAMVVRDANGRD